MDDFDLIKKFIKGDEKSFDLLVKNNQDWVKILIKSIVHNEFDSDDIAQDVFVNIYFALHKFRFESSFKTWTYRIIINRINNYYRKEKIRSFFNNDLLKDAYGKYEESDGRKDDLYTMTYKLPRMQRNVVILRVFQDLQFKVISEILNISVNSAKVSFYKAKENLKRMIDGQ